LICRRARGDKIAQIKIDKGEFSNGINLDRFKEDLISANLNGVVESIDDKVTHLFINGDNDLHNTADINTINDVVAAHDGTPDPDSAIDNLVAITDPSINDDIDAGYSKGSTWINTATNKAFLCLNNSVGAAVWKETTNRREIYIHEPFHTSNLVNNSIGLYGWRSKGNGGGNDITLEQEAGHPGIIRLITGTAAGGRRSLMIGQDDVMPWILSSTGIANEIEIEWMIKLGGSVAVADLEVFQVGLFASTDEDLTGIGSNGIAVILDPSVTDVFRVMAANGGVRSYSNGSIVAVIDTWYRITLVYKDTGSGGSLQFKINGVDQGAPVTTNFPVGALQSMAKIDSNSGATSPTVDLDYVKIFHAPNSED